MKHRGKKYAAALAGLDRSRRYSVEEAVGIVKGMKVAQFNESVEVSVKLGINPKQADQNVRGSISLPKGIGSEKRVVAFCDGADVQAALDAGAVKVGAQDLADEIQGGWMDFDVAVCTPPMMRFVGKLGRILGPQGKMPSPKSGTVTDDIVSAVREFKAGRIEYRNDNTGNLHLIVGKQDFPAGDLRENIEAFLGQIRGARPASVKGAFIQKAYLTTTMGPSVPLAV